MLDPLPVFAVSQACHNLSIASALEGSTLQTCFVPSSGGSSLLPESSALEVLNWLDWEETVLKPQVHAQDSAGIKQAAQHLQSALGSSSHLIGTAPTLADVVIYAALYPVQVSIPCHLHAQPEWRAVDVSRTAPCTLDFQSSDTHVHSGLCARRDWQNEQ